MGRAGSSRLAASGNGSGGGRLASVSSDDTAAVNVSWHGGPVMHTNTIYAIYWVPAGYSVSSGYESLINRYFSDVAADSGKLTNDYAVDPQYTDSSGPAAYNSTFGGSVVDTTAYPTSTCVDSYGAGNTSVCLMDSQLQTEISNEISAKGWPHGINDLYMIFTPQNVGSCFSYSTTHPSQDACSYEAYCGYHDDFGSGSSLTIYANIPYDAYAPAEGDCSVGVEPNGDDADATINVVSHEQNESITDPELNAWYDSSTDGDEIADKCAWGFGTTLGSTAHGAYNEVIDGDDYYLQQEWSNSDAGCVQSMAAPVSVNPPTVSGVAQDGQVLSAAGGLWTTPTPSITYQWRRCDSSGNSCSNIANATSSTYTAADADVGDTLRVGATATTNHGTTGPVYSAQTVGDRRAGAAVELAGPFDQRLDRRRRHALRRAGQLERRRDDHLHATSGSSATPAAPGCNPISGQQGTSYAIKLSDAGSTIGAVVTATNAGGGTQKSATPTALVTIPAAPTNNTLPAISGTAQTGSSLSVSQGSWSGGGAIAYTYAWELCNSAGSGCATIGGQTGPSYTVQPGDAGSTIGAVVTATNAGGGTPASAAPTAVVTVASGAVAAAVVAAAAGPGRTCTFRSASRRRRTTSAISTPTRSRS